MNILALDLANSTGYAYGNVETRAVLDAGHVVLATPTAITAARKIRMDRRLDPRIPALYNWLTNFSLTNPFEWIVFEDVQFSSFTMQTQLWSSLRAAVWLFAAQNRLDVECINVKTLKKFGAGHGGATKTGMAAGLARQHDGFERVKDGVMFRGKILNDDAVDAVHLLKWAQTILQNTKSKKT